MTNYNNSIIFLICIFVLANLITTKGIEDLQMTYQQFKQKYQKPQRTPAEQLLREQYFKENLQNLKILIQQGCDFCGVTVFYDQNLTEFKKRMGLTSPDGQKYDIYKYATTRGDDTTVTPIKTQSGSLIKVGDSFPSSKNWADLGKITSIKDQGSCGTCWSFATAAAIQTSLILKGQASKFFFYEPDLSEQFLLTCSSVGNCKGGYLQDSIDLAHSKGIPYQSDLPYIGQKGNQGICSNTKNNVKYSSSDTARYSHYDISDSKIISLLQQGPLMIAVSADNWQNYGGGIFRCKSTAAVNHAVLLVGYDSDKWIIKNQWGKSWGQNGYISVTRDRVQNCKIGVAVHKLSAINYTFTILLLALFLLLLA